MTDPKQAWQEVGDRFQSLGLKLKMHFEQEKGDDAELEDQLKRLGDTIESAFTALGKAARDDAVQADVRDVARSLADAISVTFENVGESLRRKD